MIRRTINQAEQEAAKEAETQRKIAAANITHSDSRDIPGCRIARWTDHDGLDHVTMCYAREDDWLEDKVSYIVQIADYQGGSFGASHAISNISPEDAVNRWIAAWW